MTLSDHPAMRYLDDKVQRINDATARRDQAGALAVIDEVFNDGLPLIADEMERQLLGEGRRALSNRQEQSMISKYANHPKVVLNDDGTATIPDQTGGFDTWFVQHGPQGGFVLRPDERSGQGPVTEPGDRYNGRLQVFGDRDDAIEYVVGAPQ